MEKGEVTAAKKADSPTNATFTIIDTKLYVPVVTLSTQDDNKLLEQLKTGFKRTIKWIKYRSKMPDSTRNNNLDYLIDPIFTKVDRLFVLTLKMKMIEILFQSVILQVFK